MTPSNHIYPRLRRLDQMITQSVNHVFATMDLTNTQSHVLHYLSENEGRVVYPKDIEKRFGLTHPTVSGVLQRLEAKQFIVCTPDPDDRRYKRVALTERARKQQQDIGRYFAALDQILVRGMQPEEVQTLVRLLEQSTQNLQHCFDKEESNV